MACQGGEVDDFSVKRFQQLEGALAAGRHEEFEPAFKCYRSNWRCFSIPGIPSIEPLVGLYSIAARYVE
jgi:hypothetical protein